jgi:hypothetical protein
MRGFYERIQREDSRRVFNERIQEEAAGGGTQKGILNTR